MNLIRKMSVHTVAGVAAASLFLLATAGYARAAERLTKLADNVYAYVDTHGATPHNSFGANTGVIIGNDGIAVVDTLISAKEADRFIRDIRSISDKPIRYVINTHSHLDHTFGNSEFARLGAVIVSHENCRKNMLANGEANLKKAGAYGLTEKEMEGTRLSYPSLTFSDRMEIGLGGQTIQLIYPGPSHTDGSIMVYLPDKRILFAGDILFTDYHPNIASADLDSWLTVLDRVAALDAEKIVPGHGPLSANKDLADMKGYITLFDKKAKELAAASSDPQYIASELKKALPARKELEFLITANIMQRYLKKQGSKK
ncbi:MAG: MBL fold metallo-hydrolase [Nitrospiraceae bacterium]|nr:MBL fold metallo-hydrolase [Nitrospiraceae bacterium]